MNSSKGVIRLPNPMASIISIRNSHSSSDSIATNAALSPSWFLQSAAALFHAACDNEFIVERKNL